MRTIDHCVRCGKESLIYSHGLCQNCNMQNRRAKERLAREDEIQSLIGPDRTQGMWQRQLNRAQMLAAKVTMLVTESKVSTMLLHKADYDHLLDIMNRLAKRVSQYREGQ